MRNFLKNIYESILSLYRGAKKHSIRVTALLLVIVLGGIYIGHQSFTRNDRIDNTDLHDSTQNVRYTVNTYTDDGTEISDFFTEGLSLYSIPHGSFSNNRFHELDTLTIRTYTGDAEISGSTVVAYPRGINLIFVNKLHKVNTLIEQIPKSEVYRSKVLIVKTLKGYPAMIFYGREIKVYDTEINGSQVFKIDGRIIYTFNATFTQSDASLFL